MLKKESLIAALLDPLVSYALPLSLGQIPNIIDIFLVSSGLNK